MTFKTNFLLLFIIILGCQSASSDGTMTSKSLNISPEITIEQIQEAYQNGVYSVTELTQFYLNRIAEIDDAGPQLNAVLTINPDALNIAAQLDEERKSGKLRGPMHGIPVLLKDNINTQDKMPTTVGARAMAKSFPLNDSPLAAQLRSAGAVILGKANLSEWANFHSNSSSSGWSGLGGQTKNPYELSRNPCGSSAGSGAAVAANLCVVAIGTETNGSITCPSNNNGIVGIKPTVGLISRAGIVPISYNQDTGGPMARTVKDAAICLGALTASDDKDPKTLTEDRKALTNYTPFLKANGLNGKRIGFWKSPLGDEVRLTKVTEQAVDYFKSQGATIVEIEDFVDSSVGSHSFQVLLYEFKDGLNKYFAELGPDAPVKDLSDLVAQTFQDSIEMHYHDHALLKIANEKGNLESEAYLEALAKMHRMSRQEGIDKIMTEQQLDAIIAPTGGPAWKTDLTNGDNFGVFSSSPAAIAGYPNITVPMGNIDGLPVGLSIFGRAWSEPVLLEIAYGFEQGTKHRMTPGYLE